MAEKIAHARKAAAAKAGEATFGIRLHFIVRETDEEAWEADRLISKLSDEATAFSAAGPDEEFDSVGQGHAWSLFTTVVATS